MLKSRIKIRLAEMDNKKQKDLAEDLNVKPQTLSGWVRGTNNPSLEQAFRIAKALDCKVDDLWLFEEEDKEERSELIRKLGNNACDRNDSALKEMAKTDRLKQDIEEDGE